MDNEKKLYEQPVLSGIQVPVNGLNESNETPPDDPWD